MLVAVQDDFDRLVDGEHFLIVAKLILRLPVVGLVSPEPLDYFLECRWILLSVGLLVSDSVLLRVGGL